MINIELILRNRAPVLRYPRAVLLEDGCERHLTWDGKRTYYTWDGILHGMTIHASGDTPEEARQNAHDFAEENHARIRQ